MNTYHEKVNKVLVYIDFHLVEKQDLVQLAEMAYLSKFHFHRIMTSFLGEPLAVYINRVKLERAAILLKYTDNPIEKIAYAIGYETPTSFTKAFKKNFKVSPSEFKKSNIGNFKVPTIHKTTKKFNLTVDVKNINRFIVLSNQVKGIVGDQKTYDGWADLLDFAYQHKIINAFTKFIAIQWDDPTITQENNIRYDACVTINSEIIDTNKFSIKEFCGGKYLCVLYKGDYKFLPDVYNQIFRDYIFKQNYKLREEPIFEEFLNSLNNTQKKDLMTVIHIPIE